MSTNYSIMHLNLLPSEYIDGIKNKIKEIKFGELPFVIDKGFIYFLDDDSLSCVKINYDRNGIYHLFFDGQIIKFDRNTGNIYIFDFVENSQTYLCIGNFFQNPARKKILLQRFLYNLIHKLDIQRFNGIQIRHVKIFWGPKKMFVQIEPHGRERLNTPSDCISFGDLLKDIKLFFCIQWLSSLVSSLNKYSYIFQKELLILKENEFFRNSQSIQILYYSGYLNIPLSNISFIGFLFEKFLSGNVNKMVILKWAEKMFNDIFGKVILSFFMNFGELKKSTDLMNKLIEMYPSFKSSISLKCSYLSFPNIPKSLDKLNQDEAERIRIAEIRDTERKKRIKIEKE